MIDQDFIEALNKHDASIEEVRGARRHKPLVDIRQKIAIELREKGYSYPAIGDIMHRDHTSIIHLVKWRGERI